MYLHMYSPKCLRVLEVINIILLNPVYNFGAKILMFSVKGLQIESKFLLDIHDLRKRSEKNPDVT